MAARICLVSGPCGSGKTTLARLLAQGPWAGPGAAHIHTDDFYQYICRGYLPPWEETAGDQNETVIRAAAACAQQYVLGGYQVFVDGVIGPWFLAPWLALAEKGLDLRYVVLRPSQELTVARGLAREARAEFPLTEETFTHMWQMFADLGQYEPHAVDTGAQTPQESAAWLRERLAAGGFKLSHT